MIDPIDIQNATNDGKSVNASTLLVGDNSDRKGVIIVNDSANVIYLSLFKVTAGGVAVVGKGIRLNPAGGSNQYDLMSLWKGAIYAVAVGGASNVTVCELF